MVDAGANGRHDAMKGTLQVRGGGTANGHADAAVPRFKEIPGGMGICAEMRCRLQ